MYYYRGFGLIIASQIMLPELLPYTLTSTPDVHISIGKTPEKLTAAGTVHKVGYAINPNEYLLQFLNVANYYAANGNNIIVEPLAGSDEKSVRLFLLTGVMAAILHQRNAVALNAAAIKHLDGVVLFCGYAGSGKSAMLTKFIQNGYKPFCDDVCLIQHNDVKAMAAYPTIKNWENTFTGMGLPIPSTDNKIRPNLPKYATYFHDEFDTDALPVKTIFIIHKDHIAKSVEIKKLAGIEAFAEVHNNVYHRLQIYPMKKEAIHFQAISKLVANINVYQVTRSSNTGFDELFQTIQKHL
ncbi:serine kinase [Mucilaginibacter sp. HMF5004]|uniref:serine kinase n=1 Tax=Mucilaginibacter rivuli TaxID=2857527 RepID=UPI001C5DC103|nr:serine kinase [Mucilaginibacter rivuli]MBW4890008.1 serine kinase [Mucilaginibacter rivuli]